MCGRAACTLAPAYIEDRYKPKNGFRNADKLVQSFNIGPFGTSCLPVISQYEDVESSSRTVSTDAAAMRWGLIPVWQKDSEIRNNDTKLYNARFGMQLLMYTIKYLSNNNNRNLERKEDV